jgi:hypothetical protein
MEDVWLLPVFVAGWLLVSGLLAHFGGWASLAKEFAAEAPESGERYRFQSGAMGYRYFPVHYRGCLTLTLVPEGLHLSLLFLFRFQAPPILIPWRVIESMSEERVLLTRYTTLKLRDHWQYLKLRGDVGERVRLYATQQRG